MQSDHAMLGLNISEWAAIVNAVTVVILHFRKYLLLEDCQASG
jgi:hypothetical protein